MDWTRNRHSCLGEIERRGAPSHSPSGLTNRISVSVCGCARLRGCAATEVSPGKTSPKTCGGGAALPAASAQSLTRKLSLPAGGRLLSAAKLARGNQADEKSAAAAHDVSPFHWETRAAPASAPRNASPALAKSSRMSHPRVEKLSPRPDEGAGRGWGWGVVCRGASGGGRGTCITRR